MRETAMKPLTIGKVAERAGVGIETIRFYEREGLLDVPTRTASGYRQFDEDVVKRLIFISRAKELGFTLKEIKELFSLRLDPTSSCADVKAQAQAKIDDIEEKLRRLNRMKRALVKITSECSGQGATTECPILDSLDRNERRR